MLTAEKYVLRAAEMAEVDAYSIKTLGIPGSVLMERAGVAVARAGRELLGAGAAPRVVLLCGAGNNGGDGFVVARHLAESGAACEVFLLGDEGKIKGDARLNIEIWHRLGHPAAPFGAAALESISQANLIVDAMLGTGAKGGLRAAYRDAARAVNASSARVVAVDLPTGIDADTGAADPDAIRADRTITFGALKPGLLFSPGRELAGEVQIADIGFPRQAFEKAGGRTFLADRTFTAGLMPQRARTAFKNRCGQVIVIAGSVGMDGAASLCASATLAAGAGLVVLGAPETVVRQSSPYLREIIKMPLAEQAGCLAADSWPQIRARLDWAEVVAAGPGLGVTPGTQVIIQKLIENYTGLLILDADGLNALAGEAKRLQNRQGDTIITPHPGEFHRLTGIAKEKILADPVTCAREFARNQGVHLLLKGAPSVAALPDGRVFINSAGNPGMATAGMGDVLTGVLAGLGGQLTEASATVVAGMYAHSLAGDFAAKKYGELSLIAGHVLEMLPAALQDLVPERRR